MPPVWDIFWGVGLGCTGVKSSESSLTLDAVRAKTKKLASEVRSYSTCLHRPCSLPNICLFILWLYVLCNADRSHGNKGGGIARGHCVGHTWGASRSAGGLWSQTGAMEEEKENVSGDVGYDYWVNDWKFERSQGTYHIHVLNYCAISDKFTGYFMHTYYGVLELNLDVVSRRRLALRLMKMLAATLRITVTWEPRSKRKDFEAQIYSWH